MQINQLVYLVEVAKTNSFSKAANNLFVSLPSITKGINNLEEEFGIAIFNRTNRGVELTPLGKEFLDHVQYILSQINNLNTLYLAHSDIQPFELKVSSDVIFCLADIISELINTIDTRNMHFSVTECFREQVISDVSNLNADIGLIAINMVEEKLWKNIMHMNKIEFYELKKEDLRIYVGSKHPLYNRSEIHPSELKDYTCIHLVGKTKFTLGGNIDPEIKEVLATKSILSLNDKETIAKVIQSTNAYTFASECRNHIYGDNNIKGIPITNKNMSFLIGWIKRKDIILSSEAENFIEKFSKSLEY